MIVCNFVEMLDIKFFNLKTLILSKFVPNKKKQIFLYRLINFFTNF